MGTGGWRLLWTRATLATVGTRCQVKPDPARGHRRGLHHRHRRGSRSLVMRTPVTSVTLPTPPAAVRTMLPPSSPPPAPPSYPVSQKPAATAVHISICRSAKLIRKFERNCGGSSRCCSGCAGLGWRRPEVPTPTRSSEQQNLRRSFSCRRFAGSPRRAPAPRISCTRRSSVSGF